MAFVENSGLGELLDGDIRYVLMRPDVLMGIARHLPPEQVDAFFRAFEDSAFANAQASFENYKENARFDGADFLESSCRIAESLGWGQWSIQTTDDGAVTVQVSNSPFAAGHGPADRPVCSPITGILRAIAQIGYGQVREVAETACAAQGAPQCSFHMTSPEMRDTPGLDEAGL